MKPSLPYQGIARRALEIAGTIFDDDMVIATSDNCIEEKEFGFRLIKGQNLSFIAASTYVHKYHVVNRVQPPCPACAHGIPVTKRR